MSDLSSESRLAIAMALDTFSEEFCEGSNSIKSILQTVGGAIAEGSEDMLLEVTREFTKKRIVALGLLGSKFLIKETT